MWVISVSFIIQNGFIYYRIMKTNSRFLPRLNLCYLQKKAYEKHREHVTKIRSSLSNTHTSHRSILHLIDTNSPHNKEQRKSMEHGSTPYTRKYFKHAEQENLRLMTAIRKCEPTLNHQDHSRHSERSQQVKKRIMKFKTDPSSDRKVLKSEYSCEKIAIKEKKNSTMAVSRLFVTTTSHRQQQQLKNIEVNIAKHASQLQNSLSKNKGQFFNQSPKHRQQQLKRTIQKNLQKVRNHIQNRETRLISKEKLEGYRQKSSPGLSRMHISQIHRWKTRAFKTQMDTYEE